MREMGNTWRGWRQAQDRRNRSRCDSFSQGHGGRVQHESLRKMAAIGWDPQYHSGEPPHQTGQLCGSLVRVPLCVTSCLRLWGTLSLVTYYDQQISTWISLGLFALTQLCGLLYTPPPLRVYCHACWSSVVCLSVVCNVMSEASALHYSYAKLILSNQMPQKANQA